ERNSTVVSFGFSSTSFFSIFSSFFATVALSYLSMIPLWGCFVIRGHAAPIQGYLDYSVYQPQRPIPARDLKDVGHCVCQVLQACTQGRWRISIPVLHRPVDH